MKEIEQWNQFCNACTSQWRAAGNKRFAYDGNKELSDVITDILGNTWIGGQILKYAGELWNTKRMDGIIPEVNFFKITVYTFIWWIKEFKQKYTDPALKEKYWPEFIAKVRRYYKEKLHAGTIEKERFFEIVGMLKEGEDARCKPPTDLFLEMGARAYCWWRQEMGFFTDRDEGEEFTK